MLCDLFPLSRLLVCCLSYRGFRQEMIGFSQMPIEPKQTKSVFSWERPWLTDDFMLLPFISSLFDPHSHKSRNFFFDLRSSRQKCGNDTTNVQWWIISCVSLWPCVRVWQPFPFSRTILVSPRLPKLCYLCSTNHLGLSVINTVSHFTSNWRVLSFSLRASRSKIVAWHRNLQLKKMDECRNSCDYFFFACKKYVWQALETSGNKYSNPLLFPSDSINLWFPRMEGMYERE